MGSNMQLVFFNSLYNIVTERWTHDEISKGYMDGMLPSSDARLVLLGYEGSGKSCLADTLVGKSFQEDTAPTEGADQFEIGVTTAANWELMDEPEKLKNMEKLTFLETEYFLSSKDSQVIPNETPFVPSTGESNQPETEAKAEHSGILSKITAFFNWSGSLQSDKNLQPHQRPNEENQKETSLKKPCKTFIPISPEEFQQIKALQEEYDPEKKYIHLWDFAGQQVTLMYC